MGNVGNLKKRGANCMILCSGIRVWAMWGTGEWIGANCRILYISGVSFTIKAIYKILMLFYDSLHGDMSFPYTEYGTT